MVRRANAPKFGVDVHSLTAASARTIDELSGDELYEAVMARRAELSLSEYVPQAWPVIEPGSRMMSNWHIDLICEYLEAVTAGQITRLLINIPPRHMKTNLVSILWPTWEWIRNPSGRWIFASYAQTLTSKASVERRMILLSDWYQRRWGDRFEMTSDLNLKTEFSNNQRGYMIATSTGGSIMGKGGSRLIADDLHNPEEVESDTERTKTVTYFDRTLSTRLDNKKTDAIIVVAQRLHLTDVCQRCIELGYTHVKIPAVAPQKTTVIFPVSGRTFEREPGDLLWPEREGPKEIAAAKLQLGSYGFSALLQQEPIPAGGGLFKRAWFADKFVDTPPKHAFKIRYWDKAGTQEGGAYTAGVLMAMGLDRRVYILDVIRGQWSALEREATIKATSQLDRNRFQKWYRIFVEQEPGSSGKEAAESTVRNLHGFDVRAERPTGDKVVRARPLSAQCEGGNVYLVRGLWNDAFLDELSVFPMGLFKDQVDAASGAYNKLSKAVIRTGGYAAS